MKLFDGKLFWIFLTIVWALSASSCNQDYEGVFPGSPDDRVRETLDEYKDLVTQAPFGWKAALYTGSGAGYFFHFEFKDKEEVIMLSDFNEHTAGEAMTGTWAIKALQKPTLSFTTYSYVHLPADPDGDINNGIPGSGLLSDFEFAFVRSGNDSVVLKGIQHGTEVVMVRATEEEREQYYTQRIRQLIQSTGQYLASARGYRLSLPNDQQVPMALSISRKLIAFQYLDSDGETILTPTTSFIFTVNGIRLREELVVNNYTIRELIWDDSNGLYVIPFDTPVPLVASDDPFIFYPSVALNSKVGNEPVTAVIPRDALTHPLPGQSESFTAAFQFAATRMKEGQYNLDLEKMEFVFVPFTNRMLMVVSVLQPSSGGGAARFTAQYAYSYQLRDDGTIKFKSEGMDQNAAILYDDMVGILMHFDNDAFRMEYVGGDFSLIAGFFSQEEPDYYFSGYLVN